MKGLEPRPAWARMDVGWRCWLMMTHRLPHFALSGGATWRPWIVLCAAACALLGGCRSGKPAANCTTGIGAGAVAAQGDGCGHGPWCLFGRSNSSGGPVLSPFLPVPTQNVYNYAATPLTVVPVTPVSGPAPGGPPPDTLPPDMVPLDTAPPEVVPLDILPPSEGEAIPLRPPGPLPAPWRDVPGEPLPRADDAPRFEGRTTAAFAEQAAVPAAAQPGNSTLRIRAETLQSRPTAAHQVQ